MDWGKVVADAVTVGVVAFLVMQIKEWFDAGRFDTPGTAADGVMIGVGMFVVSAILQWWNRPRTL